MKASVWVLWILFNGAWQAQDVKYPDLAACDMAGQSLTSVDEYVCSNETILVKYAENI